MPLLTKKFTRDSLKRANGGGAGIPNESEDSSQAEMVRARIKSMRSRNALNQQQRRHRSLSRGPSSPYRSFGLENVKAKMDPGGPKIPNPSHPNDEYSQAYNEAELITQMSSLTEPTWAASVVGGADINPSHHRQNHQNQRNRTGTYNNFRHQTRFQHKNARVHQSRATITVSTANDHKQTKVLLLDSIGKGKVNARPSKTNSNHGHHERTSVGTEGIEVHHMDRDEGREDEGDDKTIAMNTGRFSKDTACSEMRDDVPGDDVALSTHKIRHSSSRRRSKTRREGVENSTSRTRGRSGRPSSNRKSKKRSSSVSSQRSKQSARTASTKATVSKYSSSSASLSTSVPLRKSKTEPPTATRRRRTTRGEKKSSTIIRSSSVPPSTSHSKRNQRTLSVPPQIFNTKETQKVKSDSTSNGKDSDDVVTTRINQCDKTDEHKQNLKTNSESNNSNARDAILDTASTMAETVSFQLKSQSTACFATRYRNPRLSAVVDLPSTPSSAVQAARVSLRTRLRRSNSNQSDSSAQSESIVSTNSNQVNWTEKALQKPQKLPSVTPASPSKAVYTSRTHKLAQDVLAKKIHEQRKERRHELEMEQERQQQEEGKKLLRKELRVAVSAIEIVGEEPCHTTATTLLFDFIVFHLLILFALPQRAILYLWSRTFSNKWSPRHKNVLVMGANSTLGSETARQFATDGANLILVSHSTTSSENDTNWLVEECHELGSGKIRCYSADLSNAVSTELTLRQAAKAFDNTFDVVILNGENKSHGCLFEEIVDVHQIEKMVTENTLGCIMSLHYLLKYVPKTCDSRIVILSSISGMVASPYRSVYGATQHALKGFSDSIRMELNDTYTERRAPKICFASFPELVGQNIHHRDNLDSRMSWMGADVAPMKTHSWAGIPLQQAVHNLLGAITSGERDFGAPRYVNAWRFVQVIAPGLVDFSIFRHFRKTQYRPVEDDTHASIGRKGGKGDVASISNKTWS